MTYTERYREYQQAIEQYLNGLFTKEVPYGKLYEAIRYSILGGGKRIRPVLTLEFARLGGIDWRLALPFACALEMIHTYSLIHDDLPCMDDDDMRRGMPSCHKKFGEEYALLAGDGLLTRAFGLIAESETAKESPAVAIEAIKELSYLAGSNGMIGGQVVDLRNEGKSCSIDVLCTMDSLKTGALIKCSALLGVIAAKGTSEEAAAAVMKRY